MIKHHPDENTLTEYATGSVDRGVAIAVKTHLDMCSSCRSRVTELELIGSAMFNASQPASAEATDTHAAPVSEAATTKSFTELMAKIRKNEAEGPKLEQESHIQVAALKPACRTLPKVVQKLIAAEQKFKWNFLSPSLKQARLGSGQDKYEVCLHRIRKGGKVAEHDHRGTEITVILEGAFSDEHGSYRKGDYLLREPGQKHRPTATQDQDCLCLSVVAAPVKLSGIMGSLLNPFMRIKPA